MAVVHHSAVYQDASAVLTTAVAEVTEKSSGDIRRASPNV